MPKISLGTCCGSDPTVGLEPWLAACGADVCGIDTAWDYKDQPAIGSLLKAQKTKRESIFITTKVPPSAALCDATKGGAATLAATLLAWRAQRKLAKPEVPNSSRTRIPAEREV